MFISRFSCVGVCTFISESAATCRFEFLYIRDRANKLHEFPFRQPPFFKFVQGRLFAFPKGLLPGGFGVRVCASVVTTFSITFRVSVRCTCRRRWMRSSLPCAFLVGFMLECARISKTNVGHSWPTVCSLLLSELFLAFALPFTIVFPLFGAPTAGLSSSWLLAFKWESMIFCSRCFWATHSLQSAIVIFLVTECRLLTVDFKHIL